MPLKLLVIGAGPVGLECAVHAVRDGHHVTLVERGHDVAANVAEWGHVNLFSANEINLSTVGKKVLAELGIALPDPKEAPNGAKYITAYLKPLLSYLQSQGDDKCQVLLNTEVISVSRSKSLKGEDVVAVGKKGRLSQSFRALVEDGQGKERYLESFDAVADASGTFGNPNWIGRGGSPAVGERALRRDEHADPKCLFTSIPDVLGKDKPVFLSGTSQPQRIGLIGSGYSAATTIRNLYRLSEDPEMGGRGIVVTWYLRKDENSVKKQKAGESAGFLYNRVPDDPLPDRASLVDEMNSFILNPHVSDKFQIKFQFSTGVDRVEKNTEGKRCQISVSGTSGTSSDKFTHTHDFLICNCGFRPNLEMTRELQFHQCYASEGPMKLAASLLAAQVAMEGDPAAAGDCLKQAAPGPELLTTPEPNFFVLGMKSYGRGSAFLLRIGHSQVQSVMELLQQAHQ